MGWPWTRRELKPLPYAPPERAERGAYFSVILPEDVFPQAGLPGAGVSRADALSVPAVLRCRNLIAGTLGSLPLHLHGPDRRERPSRLLDQPEPDVPRSVTMTRTFEDILLDGVAWWRITAFGWDSYPVEVRRIDPGRVTVDDAGRVFVDTKQVPDSELIRFDSPNPSLLDVGARAIRTCLKLDQAAARYADEPMPQGFFTPSDGVDQEEAAVQEFMDNWSVSRNTRATAYVGAALKYQPLQWNPEQLQLADARQHAVLEISRLAGVDPEDLGVSTTSRTYQNAEQRRLDLLDFTLGAYVSALQDRLSMGDVTPRGYYTRFAFGGFLRTDTLSRYQAYKAGLEVGALAPDEIRDLEDKPSLSPAQRRAAPAVPAPAVPAPARTPQPLENR